MKRFAGAACLPALTAGLPIGADQIESKHAERDAFADTGPNSGRGVSPILAERDSGMWRRSSSVRTSRTSGAYKEFEISPQGD
jgi:hypothetical protein